MTHTPLKFSSRSPLPNENVGFVVFGFRVFSKVIHGSTRRAHPQRGSTLLFSIHDGATACSKSAARAHCREVRSLLAFEMATRRMLARDRLLSASYIRTYVRTYIRTYVRTYIYETIAFTRFSRGGGFIRRGRNQFMGLGCQFIRRLRCFTTVGVPTIIDRLRVRTYVYVYVRIYVRTHT